MPSLRAHPFPGLIQSIPVLEHSIQVDASDWQEKFTVAGQTELWTTIFPHNSSIRIKRDRLLNHQYPTHEQKCVEILLWGYPNDMRGIVSKLLPATSLAKVVACTTASDDWQTYYENFGTVRGINSSTITKLAYFYKKQFGGLQALILDGTLIETISRWNETAIPGLSYPTVKSRYVTYLETMHRTAKSISCKGDQLELFLFAFGNGF